MMKSVLVLIAVTLSTASAGMMNKPKTPEMMNNYFAQLELKEELERHMETMIKNKG